MNAGDFRASIETERQTELDRIGSSKRLVALTDATLDDETVLRAAAASEAAAAAVFEEWAADADGDTADADGNAADVDADTDSDAANADPDGDAGEAFASFENHEREHYERICAELGDDVDVDADPGAVHETLREFESTVGRAGGMVGRGLVAERTLTQFVSYFVNQADEQRADLFRDLKAETQSDTEAAVDLLQSAADGDDDWEAALAAALEVVDAAYGEYVDALESMGVNAKSIC